VGSRHPPFSLLGPTFAMNRSASKFNRYPDCPWPNYRSSICKLTRHYVPKLPGYLLGNWVVGLGEIPMAGRGGETSRFRAIRGTFLCCLKNHPRIARNTRITRNKIPVVRLLRHSRSEITSPRPVRASPSKLSSAQYQSGSACPVSSCRSPCALLPS
jgi:hypothetical protein